MFHGYYRAKEKSEELIVQIQKHKKPQSTNPYVHVRSKGHFQSSLNIIISTVIRPSCLLISQDVPSYPHPPIFARTLYHTLVEMMVVGIQPGNSWNGNEGLG